MPAALCLWMSLMLSLRLCNYLTPAASLSPSRIAVKIIFFLTDLFTPTISRGLPGIQQRFGIDNGTLGVVLLSSSLGALLAMPFTGWLIIRNEAVVLRSLRDSFIVR